MVSLAAVIADPGFYGSFVVEKYGSYQAHVLANNEPIEKVNNQDACQNRIFSVPARLPWKPNTRTVRPLCVSARVSRLNRHR